MTAQPVPADPKISSSTFVRLLALGVLFINLSVISLAGLWLYNSRADAQKDARQITLDLSHVLEEYIGGVIRKIDLELLGVADEIERQIAGGGIDEKTINEFLARHTARLPEVMSLRVCSADGTLKYGTGVERTHQINNADRIYFIRQRENPNAGLVIAPAVFTRVDKKWAIPISRRFNLPDGSFGGVVFTNLPLEGLTKEFSGIAIGKGGVVTLLDGELKVVARYPEPEGGIGNVIGKSTLSSPIQRLVNAQTESGTYTTKSLLDNIERTYSYHKIEGRPLYITVGLATEEYLAEWWGLFYKLLAVVAVFLLGTISSSWFIANLWKRQIATNEALRESERELANAQQIAHLGNWELDIQTGKGIWSDESYRIFGFTPGAFEPTFDKLMGFIHPEDRKTIEDILHKILSGDLSQAEFDMRIIRPDGEERVVHDKLEVITDEAGKLIKIIGVNFDITERKLAEEDIVRSERKYSSLFASMRNGFAYCKMIFDESNQPVDWIYLEVNDAFERVIGLKKEAVEGKRATEIFPTIKDFKPNLFEIYGQVALTGVGTEFTINFDILNIWLNISVYCPQKGYFAAVFDDVTEIKRAEEVLRVTQIELQAQNDELRQTQEELSASSAKYVNLYDFAPIGYFTLSGQGLVLEANLTAANLLGMTRNHLVNQPFTQLIVPEDQDIYYLFNKQPFESGNPRGCELRMARQDGAMFWARLEVNIAEDAPIRRYVVMSDISDRKLAEARLQESEARHRAIMESANDPIICIDENGKVSMWNKSAHRVFGYSNTEMFGKDVHDFIVPEKYREQARKGVSNFLQTGEGVVLNKMTAITAIRKDGTEFPIELSIAPVKMKDGWGAAAIIRDITAQKEWEKGLTDANEKLKKASDDVERTRSLLIRQEKLSAMGQLSAGVAHELKNPLNIISTSTQLMMMEEGLPAEALEGGKVIMKQIARAVKIIDNLRDFARVRKPETKEIDLCQFIERTISLVEYEIKGEGIEFAMEFPPETVRVIGDEDQLAQVFLNIVNNARDSVNEKKKAINDEATLKPEWKANISIKIGVDDSNARISFRDTGMGMKPEQVSKVFDPFYTSKGEGKGTGLGLSIALGIIESHGGSISVKSEEGEGAEFSVTLPLAPPKKDAGP